jgi:hypothetical protein
MRSSLGSCLGLVTLFVAAQAAHGTSFASAEAQQILVAEILPNLAGTELGAVPIAAEPLPGGSITIRRGDVLRALDQAGFSGKDLTIPKLTRISREVVSVSKEDLLDESMEALTAAAGACDLQTARISNDAKVIAGPRTIHAELPMRSVVSRATTLHVSGAIFVESGGQRVRVPVMASLACPPPDVSAGTQLTVFAKIGTVRASAPAEARQPGRVGDIIRVTNRATGASLRVKILSSQMAEVVP